MLEFLLAWLLCTVAFVISPPIAGDTPGILRAAAAGALVAIAISFVGGGHMAAVTR